MAAAVYFARQKIRFVLIAQEIGGQVRWSSDVENYLGFHLLPGAQLVEQFQKHLADYEEAFDRVEVNAERVDAIEGGFRIQTVNRVIEARFLLIATGTKHRALHVPGEKEYYGKGVTYCATCDAPLFRGKTIFVIGGGNSAMDAALFVEKYAKHVTIVSVNAELGGDAGLKTKVQASPKITVLPLTKTTKILGDEFVSGIALQGPDGEDRIEKTEGVFIEVGLEPSAQFIDMVAKDKYGQIIVDKFNATSVPGIWAAGDVTDVTEKQIAVAVGEGSKAALAMIRALQRQSS